MYIFNISIILLLLGIFTFTTAETTIDQKIAAIMDATPQERVLRMNKFKQSLARMNTADRSTAITQMRSKMSQNNVPSNTQTKVDQYVNQATQNKDIQMGQQMSQKQTATQAMQQGLISNSGSNGVGGANKPIQTNGTKIPNKFLNN